MEFYAKFLNYKLEDVRQRPMDWLAFLKRKRTELANTGHKMDDETFITHLLNSLPQVEYEGAIFVIKEKLRRGTHDLPEIEQILEDKYQSVKYVKGWDEEEDDYVLFASPNNKKEHKKQFKGRCGCCGEFGHKAADCPNKKSNQKKGPKGKTEKRRRKRLKGTIKERERQICLELNATIVENLDSLHETAQSPARTLILLKKMSKTGNPPK